MNAGGIQGGEGRKVTCTGVNTPWQADKCKEKMDFPVESFHCPGQTYVNLGTVKRTLHICTKPVKMLMN